MTSWGTGKSFAVPDVDLYIKPDYPGENRRGGNSMYITDQH